MKPVRITAPATGAVSLDEIKKYGRVDASEDDAQMTLMMDAATGYLDGFAGILGRCLVNQVWRQRFSIWRPCLVLPFPDVSDITVTYVDQDSVVQTVDPTLYEIIDLAGRSAVSFRSGFSAPGLDGDQAFAISVDLTAGFGDQTQVPAPLKVAIVRLGIHWYDFRSEVGNDASVPFGVSALVAPYRMSLA